MVEAYIGFEATVIDSPNRYEIGHKGLIKEETKYTFKIGEKIILKNGRTFEIRGKKVDGKKILQKYYERLK